MNYNQLKLNELKIHKWENDELNGINFAQEMTSSNMNLSNEAPVPNYVIPAPNYEAVTQANEIGTSVPEAVIPVDGIGTSGHEAGVPVNEIDTSGHDAVPPVKEIGTSGPEAFNESYPFNESDNSGYEAATPLNESSTSSYEPPAPVTVGPRYHSPSRYLFRSTPKTKPELVY